MKNIFFVFLNVFFSFLVGDVYATNHVPTFVNGNSYTINICKNSVSDTLNVALAISDIDPSQTETWSLATFPLHGSLSGFPYTHVSATGVLTPINLTYTPYASYVGVDTFLVRIYDGFDTSIIQVSVIVNNPVLTLTPANTSVCLGSGTILSVSGANTYTWSPNIGLSSSTGNSVVATSTVSTTYTVTGKDVYGCISSAKDTVNVIPVPSSPAVTHLIQYCIGSSSTPLSATGTYLLWYSSLTGGVGSSTAPIPSTGVVGSTKYYVSQTINGCESRRDSITVKVNSLPAITLSPSSFTLCSGSNVVLIASGGISYSWAPGLQLSSTSGNTVTATPTSSRIYVVTGVDSNGCSDIASTNITVNPNPAAITVNPSQVSCVGVSTTLSCPTAGGVWSSSNSSVAAVTSSGIVTGLDTGAVVISYTLATGCYSKVSMSIGTYNLHLGIFNTCFGNPIVIIDPTTGFHWGGDYANSIGVHYTHFAYSTSSACQVDYTVNVNPYPNPISGDSILCVGSIGHLYNDSSGFWSSSNTSIITIDSNGLLHAVSPGTAVVTFRLATGCTTAVNVVVNPLPVSSLVSSATGSAICIGQSTTLTATGGFYYSWTPSYALNATTGHIVIASPTITTTYSVQVTDVNGCINTSTKTIIVNPLPIIVASSVASTICSGQTTTLTATGGNTYSWLPVTGLTSSVGSTVSAHPTITTTYTVTGININGCANTSVITVTVNPTPVISTSGTSFSICLGTMATLSASGASSYTWMPSSNLSSSSGATTVSSATVTTVYTVTGIGANGCSNSTVVTLTVNPIPIVNSVTSQVVCNGVNTAAVNFTGTSGSNYNWVNSNPTIGLGSSGTGSISAFNGTNTGIVANTATITVTPVLNGCLGVAQIFSYTINPTPSITPITNQALCKNTYTTAINFNSSVSGTTYNWTNSISSIGLAASGTGNIASFNSLNPSTSTLNAVINVTPSANSCLGPIQIFTISVYPTPTVNSVTSVTLCNGATTSLFSFSGSVVGSVFNWSNSNTSIGLGVSGVGNITPFNVLDTSSSFPIVSTISVTPTANGCAGSPAIYTITVNPTPTVNSVSSQVICRNSLTSAITFSGSVSLSTYTWTNSNTSIGLASSGTGNIVAFIGSNTSTSPISGTVTVTPHANLCNGVSQVFTITVNPLPSVSSISPSSTSVCTGSNTGLITIIGPVSGTVYNWSNSNTAIGLASSGTGNIASFTAIDTSALISSISNIVVTPVANSCTGSTSTTTIIVNPIPVLSTIGSQTLCNGSSTSAIVFSSNVIGTTYSWTNSNSLIGLSASGSGNTIPTFVATNSGSTPIVATITVTPAYSGCTGLPQVFTITVNPTPNVGAVANQVVCNNTSTSPVSFTGSVSGSLYTWTNSNSSIGLAASGTGNIGVFTAINTSTITVVSTIAVIPTANSCVGATRVFSISVTPQPIVLPVPNVSFCNASTSSSISFSSNVPGATYTWSNSNTTIGLSASGSGNIAPFAAVNSLSVAVTSTITVTPFANGCTGLPQTFTITINPTPTVNSISSQTLCNGDSTLSVLFSGSLISGYTTTYTWTNNNTSIGLSASGSGGITSFPSVNLGSVQATATITVTPSANGCSGQSQIFSITVKPTPVISPISGQSVCNSTVNAVTNFSSSVVGTTYSWNNSVSTIGLPISGIGSVPTFTAINMSSVPIVSTISVTPTANGCAGSPAIYTITVNPTPTVNSVSSQVVCHNSLTSAITFSGSVSLSTYTWTNSNTSIGLASSGTGNIVAFTGSNTSTSPISGTVTVTPHANLCNGVSQIFTITVNPLPSVSSISPSSTSVCTGSNTGLITIIGPVSGTVYNWSNSNTAIGLASSGTGNIASFTAIDTSALISSISNIVVTPVANSCTGPTSTATITVNPIPVLSSIGSQTLCNGLSTSTIAFSSNVVGTTYSWTNSNSLIGILSSGSGTTIPSFVATNTGSTPIVATITVTPTFSGCNGTPQVFTITVNPTPNVGAVANQVVCNNTSTAPINFTGSVSGSLYTWTNSNSSIGLATTGTGNIGGFTAINTSTVTVVSTITVTPTANSCVGVTRVFTISVTPQPIVLPVSNVSFCNASTTSAITFNSNVPGATYTWSNSNTTIGLSASGSGNIAPFAAINLSSVAVTSTITVTPFANGCTGLPQTFTITINPTPTVNSVSSQTLCNGDSTLAVLFSGSSVSGYSTTYSWTNSNASIGLSALGTGNIASFPSFNFGTVQATATVTVTPSANGCNGQTQSFVITVKPTPVISPISNQSVCNGSVNPVTNFSSSVASPAYSWSNSSSSIGLPTSGIGSVPTFTAINISSVPVVSTISVTPTANGCTGSPATFSITVNPTPIVGSVSNQTICRNSMTAAITFSSSVSLSTYTWTNSNTSIGLASSGTGNIVAFTGSNTTTSPISGTISVTPNANSCNGVSQSFTVTVNPSPSVSSISPSSTSVCAGSATGTITITGPVSGTIYSWSNSNATIGLTSSGTGNIASFIAVDTSAVIASVSNIVVSPVANGCPGLTSTAIITVNPIPVLSSIGSQTLCNGSSTSTIAFSSNVVGTTYSWTNSNILIGLLSSGSGTTIPSFVATNTGSTPIVATITVTPTFSGCNGTPQVFTITVNPTPNVSAVANQVVGNNAMTSNVVFSGSMTGSIYTWTNSNSSIGLATSGTGDISSFLATNVSSSPVISIITVIPNNIGCPGNSITFTITVNPTPTLFPISNQIVCNGTLASAVIFSGIPVTGYPTTYGWSNDHPGIGLPSSGNGNVPSFNAVNNSNAPIIATLTVVPTANGYSGASQTFTITVNPSPAHIIGDTSVCALSSLLFYDSTSGGTWSHSSVSLATINSAGLFSAIFPGVDTIIYTLPTGCKSKKSIYIKPMPNPIVGADSVCVGASIPLSDLSTGGSWTCSNTSIATLNSFGQLTGVSAGIDSVFYQTSNGCSVYKVINVNPLPVPLFGPSDGCVGSSVILTDSLGNIMYNITPVTPGILTITLGTSSGCSSHVNVNIHPIPSPITGTTALCLGTSSLLSCSTSGGSWISSDTTIATISSSGLLFGQSVGTATVTYTLPTGCSRTVNVSVNNLFVITSTLSFNPTTCLGFNGYIRLFGLGPSILFSVNYLKNGVPVSRYKYSDSYGMISIDSLTAGNYTNIRVSLGGCTSNSVSSSLYDPLPPSVPILSSNSPVCLGSILNLYSTDSTSGISYSWIGPLSFTSTTQNCSRYVSSFSDSGYYKLIVSKNNCISKDSISISVITIPNTPAINGDTMVCVGSSLIFSDIMSGGVWASQNNNISINTSGLVTGLLSGFDTVLYITHNVCGYDTVNYVIRVRDVPPVQSITGSTSVCVGSSITLNNVTNGGVWLTSNSNLLISTTGVATGLLAGADTVFYVVHNICGYDTAKFSITILPLPFVGHIYGSDSVCVNGNITLYDSTIGGVWSTSNVLIATIDNYGLLHGVLAGNCIVTYTYVNSCGSNSVFDTITVNPLPNPGIITGATYLCEGQSTTLLNIGYVGSGIWSSNSLGYISSSGVLTAGMVSGIDTVTFTSHTSSCGNLSTSFFIDIRPLPNPGVISGLDSVCRGSAITLINSGNIGGAWFSSDTSIAIVNSLGMVYGVDAGAIIISYYDSTLTCGYAHSTRIINVKPLPLAGSIYGLNTMCAGGSIILTDSGSYGYGRWSGTALLTVDSMTGFVTADSVSGVAMVTYTAHTFSCGTSIAIFPITINPLPNPGMIIGWDSVCVGSSITMFSTGSLGGVWASSSSSIATISPVGVLLGMTAGTSVITYIVYTPTCGMGYVTKPIIVKPLPNAGIIVAPPIACAGASITLVDTNYVGVGYWAVSGSASIGSSSGVLVAGSLTGSVTVSFVSYTYSCGSDTTQMVINIEPLPNAGVISGIDNMCVGDTTSLVPSGSSGGVWLSSDTSIANVSLTGLVSSIRGGSVDINYIVSTVHCGMDTATKNIIVNPLPVITITPNPSIVCARDSTALTAGGASVYFWEPAIGLSCYNCSSPWCSINSNLIYTVVGTSIHGCIDSINIPIAYYDTNATSISLDTTICYGSSIELYASGGVEYLWHNSATGDGTTISDSTIYHPIITPDSTTTYLVHITENACFSKDLSVNIKVVPTPILRPFVNTTIIAGDKIQLTAEVLNDSIATYEWTPNDFSLSCTTCQSPFATPRVTTTYKVYVSTIEGCNTEGEVTVGLLCDNSQVFIPNTFTPNHDGRNDEFYISGKGLGLIKRMSVYNRWGELVFNANNIQPNAPNSGWNGTYRGAELNPDTFIYIAEVECELGEVFTFRGDISIVR